MPSKQELDILKRKALFSPCETKEDLHRWIKIFLGMDIPNTIVCDDDEQNPTNSCPMDLIWDIYSKAKEGKDPNFQQVLGYSARDAFKTLSASIIELLCLFHLEREVCHLASIEAQAKKSQEYVEKFFRRPILRDFLTSKNKRTIEMTKYVNTSDKTVLSPLQYEQLTPSEKLDYEEIKIPIKILVCNMNSVNGEHPGMLVMDELDLAPAAPVEEAKLSATVKNGKLPIIFMTSTRKFATGPVQKEIDNSSDTGLVIKHWNIIDVTEKCPPERHLPEEPKIDIYYSNDTLKAISTEEFNKLTPKEQEGFVKTQGFKGCLQNCKLFAACRGRLATKQKSTSDMLKPIDHVMGLLKKVSVDKAKAQLMCWRPASEGLIYPNFSRERHMLSPAQIAHKITGDDFPDTYTKEELIDLFKSLGAEFVAGLDHGFTHNFAVVSGAIFGHILYVIDIIAKPNLELMQRVELCKEKLLHLDPTVYPDNAYPSDNKTFKRFGFRMVDFKKDVSAGIEAVRTRMNPGSLRDPALYLLKDDAGCELLAKRIAEYSFKVDANGDLTEEPNKNNDDELDALRYLCQNVPLNRSKIVAILNSEAENQKQNGQKEWLRDKIKELTQDTLDDAPQVHGKKNGMMFIV